MGNRILRGDQQQHVHMIGLQMPLNYPAFFLARKIVEYFAQVQNS
jgi:hypothetical protein